MTHHPRKTLTYKKKGPFLRGLNTQLYVADEHLYGCNIVSDVSFQKKVSAGLKVLDNHLEYTHLADPDEVGEERTAHLRDILLLYKSKDVAIIDVSGSESSSVQI